MSDALQLSDLPLLQYEHAAHSAHKHQQRLDRHRQSDSIPVELSKNRTALSRSVLSSPLFTARRGDRAFYADAIFLHSYSDAVLAYSGPELRQDDKRVLCFLVNLLRGQSLDEFVHFDALDFVESMGWDRHRTSVHKLTDSLRRMQKACLELTQGSRTVSVQLVGRVETQADFFSVRLDTSIVGLFMPGDRAFLGLEEYRQLTDGLATWLHGFLRANYTEGIFALKDLHQASGSAASLEKFGVMVRETMPKLQEAGVVAAYSFGRGILRVAYEEKSKAKAS